MKKNIDKSKKKMFEKKITKKTFLYLKPVSI